MNELSSSPTPFHSDLLAGQTALVTGSSSGIGRAIALGLAEVGADVYLHARANAAGLAEVRQQIESLGRGGHDFLIDLSDAAACGSFAIKAEQAGPIDIWVNNAGVDVLTGDAAKWSFEKKLAALWEVDVRATVTLSRAIGQNMRRRGSGAIINIGWDQAATGMAGDSGEMFSATKGAVMAFTRSLARSLAPEVRVNCLAPGWIRTKWGAGASDYWDRRARAEALVQRWGDSREVACAAVFLASPAAAFINGQILPVDGGFAGSHPE